MLETGAAIVFDPCVHCSEDAKCGMCELKLYRENDFVGNRGIEDEIKSFCMERVHKNKNGAYIRGEELRGYTRAMLEVFRHIIEIQKRR